MLDHHLFHFFLYCFVYGFAGLFLFLLRLSAIFWTIFILKILIKFLMVSRVVSRDRWFVIVSIACTTNAFRKSGRGRIFMVVCVSFSLRLAVIHQNIGILLLHEFFKVIWLRSLHLNLIIIWSSLILKIIFSLNILDVLIETFNLLFYIGLDLLMAWCIFELRIVFVFQILFIFVF